MVVDLLLGGDLRYHIQKDVKFEDDVVFLYIAEIGLALDYMRSKNVIHRYVRNQRFLQGTAVDLGLDNSSRRIYM